MAGNQNKSLVIAISPSALFNLEEGNRILQKEGQARYYEYLRDNEDEVLQPRTGLYLIKSILELNPIVPGEVEAEVIVISRDSTDASLRIFNSARHHELRVSRGAFTSGDSTAKYIEAFRVDLFLAASETDVKDASEAHVPAGMIRDVPIDANTPLKQIRIALDGDSLLLSEEAEELYRTHGAGLLTSQLQEVTQGRLPKLLKTLSLLQNRSYEGDALIRTALISSEDTPVMEKAIRTLRHWSIRLDAAFFSGSAPKEQILDAFEPLIVFDANLQDHHHEAADAIKAAEEITHEAEEQVHYETNDNLNTEEAELADELINLSEKEEYDEDFDLAEETTATEEAIREAEEITQLAEDQVDCEMGSPFNIEDLDSEDASVNMSEEEGQDNTFAISEEIAPEEMGLAGWAKEWAVH